MPVFHLSLSITAAKLHSRTLISLERLSQSLASAFVLGHFPIQGLPCRHRMPTDEADPWLRAVIIQAPSDSIPGWRTWRLLAARSKPA